MKNGSDKSKYPGRFFAAILLLFALLLLLLFYGSRENSPEKLAERMMAEGNYTEAAELYLELGNNEMYHRCIELHAEQSYLYARNCLQMGQYSAAIDVLAALQNYKDSANLKDAASYLWAEELAGAGEYDRALELVLSVKEYQGKQKLLADCAEGVLSMAAELALGGDYAAAREKLTLLGTYGDADILTAQTEKMAVWRNVPAENRILRDENKFGNDYYEKVYVHELAYIVLPENYSADCGFLLYFPGGKDDEINIDFLYYYLMNPAPDTVAVFLRTNGIYDTASKTASALELMERVAAECGLLIREIVSCGSSLGAYPAMHSSWLIPRQSGIKVPCVLSLDAGDDWNSPYCLSRSQCLECAENSTEFYLFESPWVGTDRAAIRTMVETGNEVFLVGCQFDDHLRITLDAMGMGVLHWAMGDRTTPCQLNIYSFTKLSPT